MCVVTKIHHNGRSHPSLKNVCFKRDLNASNQYLLTKAYVHTFSILFIIKIMINSEIFLTHKSEYRFSEQDETQKSNLNGEETKFYKLNHKCFSSNNLVTY